MISIGAQPTTTTKTTNAMSYKMNLKILNKSITGQFTFKNISSVNNLVSIELQIKLRVKMNGDWRFIKKRNSYKIYNDTSRVVVS